MNWLTRLWRRLFKREVKPVDPIPYLGSLAPIYKAVALAEPLPPPKSWHSAFEDVDPPSKDEILAMVKHGGPLPASMLAASGNYAEQAMREMERTDRRAQLVAAGLLADAAEADRDQKLEERVSRPTCPCETCSAQRWRNN